MADTSSLPSSITASIDSLENAIKASGSASTAASVASVTAVVDTLRNQINSCVTSSGLSTALGSYATTTALTQYAKQDDLQSYVTAQSISDVVRTKDLASYAKGADVNAQLDSYNTQWAQDAASFKQDVQNAIKNMASAGDVAKNSDDIKNLPATVEASFKDKFLSTEGNAAFGDKVCIFQTTSTVTHINGQGKLNGGITSSNFDRWNPIGFTLGTNTPLDIRNLTNTDTASGGTDYSKIYGPEGGGGCANLMENTPGFAGVTPTADFFLAATDGTVEKPFFQFNTYASASNTESRSLSGNRYGFWTGSNPNPSYTSKTQPTEAPIIYEDKDVIVADGQKVAFATPFPNNAEVSVYTQLLTKGAALPVFVGVSAADTTSCTLSVIGVDGKPYTASEVHVSLMAVGTVTAAQS